MAFKSGVNKKALKASATINKRKEEDMKYGDETVTMEFVEKFVEVFRQRNNLHKSQKRNGASLGLSCGETNYTIKL